MKREGLWVKIGFWSKTGQACICWLPGQLAYIKHVVSGVVPGLGESVITSMYSVFSQWVSLLSFNFYIDQKWNSSACFSGLSGLNKKIPMLTISQWNFMCFCRYNDFIWTVITFVVPNWRLPNLRKIRIECLFVLNVLFTKKDSLDVSSGVLYLSKKITKLISQLVFQ